MACTNRFASASEYNEFFCFNLDLSDPDMVNMIELVLDIAAADIHAVMAAVGACSCSLADWTTVYLKKLNIIDALVMHSCPCSRTVTEDMRIRYLDWVGVQFDNIRTGKVPLCQDDTGSEYPAWGSIEQGLTSFSRAEIVMNAQARLP